jgi:hypothetical protein
MNDISRSSQIRVTAMPAHTNTYGGVFGMWLRALEASSLASRVAASVLLRAALPCCAP